MVPETSHSWKYVIFGNKWPSFRESSPMPRDNDKPQNTDEPRNNDEPQNDDEPRKKKPRLGVIIG